MGLLFLIPGIILLETDGWFHDQHTVGQILTWAGAILLVLQLLFFIIVVATGGSAVRKTTNRW